jgi:hypothetical protein
VPDQGGDRRALSHVRIRERERVDFRLTNDALITTDNPVLREQAQGSDSSKPVPGQGVARNRTDTMRYTS